MELESGSRKRKEEGEAGNGSRKSKRMRELIFLALGEITREIPKTKCIQVGFFVPLIHLSFISQQNSRLTEAESESWGSADRKFSVGTVYLLK